MLQKLKIPRISDPSKIEEVLFEDLGNVKFPGCCVSVFSFNGEFLRIFCEETDRQKRFSADVEFLKKHDLDLLKVENSRDEE